MIYYRKHFLFTFIVCLFLSQNCAQEPVHPKAAPVILNGLKTDNTTQQEVQVVLLHGLKRLRIKTSFFPALKKKIPNGHFLIIKEKEVFTKSLSAQVQSGLATLDASEISKEIPLFIVGHSQGALRAIGLGAKAREQGYSVKGIACIGGPLEGAEGLYDVEKKITESTSKEGILHQALTDCVGIFLENKADIDKMVNKLIQQIRDWYTVFLKEGEGLTDMLPGSVFIEEVKNILNTTTIPLLTIGTTTSFMKEVRREPIRLFLEKYRKKTALVAERPLKVVPTPSSIVKMIPKLIELHKVLAAYQPQIDPLYDRLISEEGVANDGVIPITSQCAKNITNKHITRVVLPNISHLNQLKSKKVANHVSDFINEHR